MKKTFVFLGIFLIIFLFSSAFYQQEELQVSAEDADLEASGVVSISPAAVALPNNWFYHKDNLSFSRTGSSFYFADPAEGDAWAYVPVNLPHGTIVSKFAVYLIDNDDTVDAWLFVGLYRHNHTTGTAEQMASVTTDGLLASPDTRILKDLTVDYAQVKNHVYSYYLYLDAEQQSPDVKFNGAKIVYQ